MFIDDKAVFMSIAFASALLVCLALVFALVSVVALMDTKLSQ